MTRATVVEAFAKGLEDALEQRELHDPNQLFMFSIALTNQLRAKDALAPVGDAMNSRLLRALAKEEGW